MTERNSFLMKAIALSILAVGLLLVGFQLIGDGFESVETLFIKVETPVTYRFDKYAQLLKEFVKDHSVDYAALKKSPLLKESMREIAHISPAKMINDKERLSYWLNVHNLIAIKEIADHFPITDLKQLGNDPTRRKFTVGGDKLSLQTIKNEKIEPLFNDNYPEEVFLMCGGAIGHPWILDHPVVPDRMDKDMKEASYLWVCEPTTVAFDKYKGRFDLGPYLQWHEGLFEKRYGSPIDFVMSFLNDDAREAIASVTIIKGYALPFNWTVNDYELRKRIEKARAEKEKALSPH
ncbi:MAG: DUF547 domain-containing protein [Candidatus Melainabacteria bacterium]|nr:DUF547 domain-containing protein [Candidatus Melainabacteria bacterium]